LDALGECHVEALAQLGNAALRLAILLLGDLKRLFERAELAAQSRDLLAQHLDLGERPRRDLLLGVELAGKFVDPSLCARRAAALLLGETLVAIAFALGAGETGAQLRDLIFERKFVGLLQ